MGIAPADNFMPPVELAGPSQQKSMTYGQLDMALLRVDVQPPDVSMEWQSMSLPSNPSIEELRIERVLLFPRKVSKVGV